MLINNLASRPRMPAIPASRRGLFAGLTGGILATSLWPLVSGETSAKKNGKRKPRAKRRKKRQSITAPIPPGPLARADATCPGPSQVIFVIDPLARVAQTFTALASGSLVSAQLGIDQAPNSRGEYLLRLSPVDRNGVPTDDVLAASVVTSGAVPVGESTVTFIFQNPASVVAGTRYALVLSRPGPDQFTWQSRGEDACIGQAFVAQGQAATFEPRNDVNFIYTVFVSS